MTDDVWTYRTEQLGNERVQLIFRYSCHGSKLNSKRKVRKVFRQLKKQLREAMRG